MPKFRVTTRFDLETSVDASEVDTRHFEPEGVEDYEDNSYFSSEDVTAEGGSIAYTIEADSEEDAEDKASEAVNDGNEVEDGNGWTWITTNVEHDIEQLQMSIDEAAEFLTSWLSERRDLLKDTRFVEAMDVLLENAGN